MLVLPQTELSNKFLDDHLIKCNIKAVFRNNNTLQRFFRKNNMNNKENRACIYEIPCQDCPKSYIGETIDFNRRKRELRDSLRNGDK